MSKFEQCLKEAYELKYGKFCPELDNLVSQDIESIISKVVIEHDLLEEGELDINPQSKEAKEWSKKVAAFVLRWKEFESIE